MDHRTRGYGQNEPGGTRTAGAGQGSQPCWLVDTPSDQTGLPVQSTTVKTSRCSLFFGGRVPSRATAGVGCLLVKPSTPDSLPVPRRQIQGSAVGAQHVPLQARRCGATSAGARISLWSSWGLRPTPAPRKTYMKPAFCSVWQQVLGANLAKETSGSQQILLKTEFKTHQLPSPPNLPDASHRGNLVSRPAAIATPREPRLLSLCCCCFFSSSRFSLFTARQS